MGAAIPSLQAGLLNQPSAQVIDGSLKFNETSGSYLTRTPSSSGNRRTWTWSCWCKIAKLPESGTNGDRTLFSAVDTSNGGDDDAIRFIRSGITGGQSLYWSSSEYNVGDEEAIYTNAVLRDPNAFYHVVLIKDTTQSSLANGQMRMYINGVEQSLVESNAISQNAERAINSQVPHAIGDHYAQDRPWDGMMTQVYLIDGLALGPGYFGFTDPLTNTWRPKKFKAEGTTVNDGTVWSSYLTASSGSIQNIANAFDGNTTTYNNSTTNDVVFTFTPPTPIRYKNSVRIWLRTADHKARINGGTYIFNTGAPLAGQWMTLATGSGLINTIDVQYTANSSTAINAIEVDGVIMRDSTTTNLDFGTNGFYLPMDGNSPIGQDKSGNGNNWTPVNFGSSVGLDKATGALPILNTVSGGNHATVGVRTDAYHANLVLAVPLVGNANDVSNSVNSGTTTKSVTVSGATASTAESNIYGGSFVFDGSNDEITVGGVSTDLDFGTGDYTAEAWFRLTGTGDEYIISMGTDHGGAAPHWGINIYSTNLIRAGRTNSGGDTNHYVTHPFITNKWYHVAISRSGGISRLFLDGNLLDEGSNSDDIDPTTDLKIGRYGPGAIYYNGYIQDVRIYKGVGKYTESFNPPSTSPDILPDTPSGVSGSSKLTKITDGAVTFDGSGDYLTLANSSDFVVGTGDFTMECYIYQKSQGGEATVFGLKHTGGSGWTGYKFYITTSGNFILYAEDAGSGDWDIGLQAGNGSVSLNRWHHLSATRNGTTFRVFVDGILKASTTSSVDLNDGGDGFYISNNGANQQYFNGIISNIRIIKGTALYTTDFTPPTRTLTNVTNTKLLCCQSPTSATEGVVKPGTITANGDAAATNFNPFTTDINAVRGQETGYATLNPLSLPYSASGDTRISTVSNGNLTYDGVTSYWGPAFSTIPLGTTGKYYFETIPAGGSNVIIGVGKYLSVPGNRFWDQGTGTQTFYYNAGGNIGSNGSTLDSNPGSISASDVIGFAMDCDRNIGKFYKNGVLQATVSMPAAVITAKDAGTVFPFCDTYNGTDVVWNFGQKPFKFPPPAGFSPLNVANVRPETVITRPNQFVDVSTWSGDGGSRTFTGLSLKPDLVWCKIRSQGYDHVIWDSVRGAGVLKELVSNDTRVEGGASTNAYGYISEFTSNGFITTAGSSNNYYFNQSSQTYVAWCWKAGGNKNTFNVDDVGYASAAAAGLDGGNKTPTGASVGTKQGFSIIKYDGAGTSTSSTNTISHGLLQAPTFLIVKGLTGSNAADDWFVYHKDIGATKRIRLNLTNAADTQNWLGNTVPTSSLVTITQGWYSVNYNGHTHIMYAWHDVPGLQKFGSYEGNESTDGPYVELGFRPAILLVKNADEGSNDWKIYDGTRNPHNVVTQVLYPNAANGEDANTGVDFLSNGFKWRDSGSSQNGAETIIYAAWAEAPTFNLYGAQSNAR